MQRGGPFLPLMGDMRRTAGGETTDRELADLVLRDGDEAAFRTLYRRHTPALFRFVLRLVGGREADAEDIVQDAWLRAARGLGEFRWRSSFRTWLTGIALNRTRELLRRDGRTATVPENGPGGRVLPDKVPERIDLERAVGLLPPGYRIVLVLHDVEGFTHAEIGGHLGIAPETSRSQLFHARRTMRRLLNPVATTPDRPRESP